jgi:hypothetical protein
MRCAWENAGDYQFFSKRSGSFLPGYYCNIGTAGQVFFHVRDAGGANANSNTLSLHGRGAWHAILCSVNRTTNQMYIRSSYRGYDVDNIAAVGSLTNANLFRFGGGPASGGIVASARCQIAYAAVFEDVAAEALGNGAAAMAAFWEHDNDYNGLITSSEVINSGVSTTIDGAADIGVRICDWHVKSFPFAYHAAFSHNSKLALFVPFSATTQLIIYTDTFTGASWTKVNIATTASGLLMDDSPRDWREAQQVEATANNGYLYDAFVSVAGRLYCLSIFVKRHSTQATDVPGRLIFWNATAGAERAGVDFVATSVWQEVRITIVAAAGQIASQLRVRIDNNGDKIALSRCTATDNANYPQGAYAGGQAPTVGAYSFSAVMPAVEAWLDSARGEVYIDFALPTDFQEATAQFYNFRGPANNIDRQYGVLNTSEQLGYVIYDQVPAVVANYYTAAHADLSAQHILRYQYDAANPITPGVYARTILDGVVTDGPGVGWTPDGNTLDRFFLGMSYVFTTQLGGFIACFCTYSAPQDL